MKKEKVPPSHQTAGRVDVAGTKIPLRSNFGNKPTENRKPNLKSVSIKNAVLIVLKFTCPLISLCLQANTRSSITSPFLKVKSFQISRKNIGFTIQNREDINLDLQSSWEKIWNYSETEFIIITRNSSYLENPRSLKWLGSNPIDVGKMH